MGDGCGRQQGSTAVEDSEGGGGDGGSGREEGVFFFFLRKQIWVRQPRSKQRHDIFPVVTPRVSFHIYMYIYT